MKTRRRSEFDRARARDVFLSRVFVMVCVLGIVKEGRRARKARNKIKLGDIGGERSEGGRKRERGEEEGG